MTTQPDTTHNEAARHDAAHHEAAHHEAAHHEADHQAARDEVTRQQAAHHHEPVSLNRLAARATTHCLTGCAIGEVLGLVIGTALAWSAAPTIALAVALAFLFGYGFTIYPLLGAGIALPVALGLAFAADTLSITVMEIVDNAVVLLIPGAMDAGLGNPLFWFSLALALGIAWLAAFPVNRWLIARGRGHAVVHSMH